jgi:hypothetical protein
MNETRTSTNPDTTLTQRRSRPVRFELIGKDGSKHGKFRTHLAAAEEAERLWPGEPAAELDDADPVGWFVQIAGLKIPKPSKRAAQIV